MSNADHKESGIFLKVTEDFIKYLDKSLESPVIEELRGQGYKVERSVLGRFGFLLVCLHPELLAKHPELLLSASTAKSATCLIKQNESP